MSGPNPAAVPVRGITEAETLRLCRSNTYTIAIDSQSRAKPLLPVNRESLALPNSSRIYWQCGEAITQ
jgi:hypothetical protein